MGDRGQAVERFQRSPRQRLQARSRERRKPQGHADRVVVARVHGWRSAGLHRSRRGDHLRLQLPGVAQSRSRSWMHRGSSSRTRRQPSPSPSRRIPVPGRCRERRRSMRAGASPRSPICRSTNPASGTRLTATSPGMNPATSAHFTIWGSLQQCSTTPCSASASSATTSGTVTTSSAASAQFLGTGIGGGSYSCAGTYQPVSDPFSFDVVSAARVTAAGRSVRRHAPDRQIAGAVLGSSWRFVLADLLRLHVAVHGAA